MGLQQSLLEAAREAGFDRVGVAPLAPPRDAERFEAWLAAGHHAEMEWLERQRPRILSPSSILPEGRSILIVGLGHSRPPIELEGGGRVARYAAGRDYHNWIGKRLRGLARRGVREGWIDRSRSIVDAGPLLERSHAAEAGLGVPSKAANLLAPKLGPWLFLGELIVDVELEPTTEAPAFSCGTCTACLDACPTGAILEPGLVSSARCISYQTIEQRGPVPRELRAGLGEWVFGCDVCSEVCPHGWKAPDLSERFGLHTAVAAGRLTSWLDPTPDGPLSGGRFEVEFQGSPLRRPRAEGLARNAALVLGNRPSDEGRVALEGALARHPSSIVREAAAWALARGHGGDAGVRARIETARDAERDADCRRELERTLDGELGE